MLSPTPPGPHRPAAPTSASAPPPPRGDGALRAALAPKCVTGTGRAPPAARARLARGQRARPGVPDRLGGGDPGGKGAQVAWLSARCGGRPPRRAARQGPASAASERERLHFPFAPRPRFLPRGRSGDFLSGKLRGSFPGLVAPPQFSAPSSLLGSRCRPAPGRRLWQPGPGGGRGPRIRRLPTRPAM